MAQITKAGREFYYRLTERYGAPNWEESRRLQGVASLLCRHARTYSRIQEAHCNGPSYGDWSQKWQDALEHKEKLLERRIDDLARQLPGVKAVKFGGDPRGATIKLVMVDENSDDWGREGLCVPNS